MKFSGRVWKLGDNVGATDLLPAQYDKAASTGKADECAKHVLEGLRPDFQADKQPGDIVVGGVNLGAGHAHYHRGAVIGSRASGISALLGDTISGLFLRGAIDDGYPVWGFRGIHQFVNDGDRLEIDFSTGEARNFTQGTIQRFEPMAKPILGILNAGSSIKWALERVAGRSAG